MRSEEVGGLRVLVGCEISLRFLPFPFFSSLITSFLYLYHVTSDPIPFPRGADASSDRMDNDWLLHGWPDGCHAARSI